MLRFSCAASCRDILRRSILLGVEENSQCKYCFRPRLSLSLFLSFSCWVEVRSWIFMPVMTRIIVVRARILKNSTQGSVPYLFLSFSLSRLMLTPSLHALGTDARARVTRWLIQQPSADWKTWLQSLRGTKVKEGNRIRASDSADYAEGILNERASGRRSTAIKMPSSAICFNINKLRGLIDFIPRTIVNYR